MPRSQRHPKIWLVVDAEMRREWWSGAEFRRHTRHVRSGTDRDNDVPAKRAASGTKHEHFPPI